MAKTTVAERVKRVPVSGPRDILSVMDQDPNYVYRWVNDLVGRIDRFLAGGYEIVNHKTEIGQSTVDRGSRLGSAITRQVGNQITAVLMRIPREYYDEDQARKAEENDAQEELMRQKASEGRYGSLQITRK